ncbi:butyrophilin subfamily 1 member A1-like isoform X2 [Anas platyrhynchos]|uniref:butyrophilin subfamily 1 member A1-like isoform X2 n=1 Tax=Anas platyrhynchos TaxID=8839 RepID=UPI003AF201E0
MKEFVVFPWKQPWDEKLSPLIMHCLCFPFAAKLREERVQKDKRLAELSSELEEKNARLAHQSARLKELATELEKKDAKLKEQAAEQAWRHFLQSHNRVKVTLDPRTAHPRLVVSQDNRRVRQQRKRQMVPDTEERFDSWCCVLGCEELGEGRHWWEIEVEGELKSDSQWALGIARKSVQRKGKTKGGIWAVRYNDGNLIPLTFPTIPLFLSPVAMRIWVCLDFTQGQVSFINADNGVEIYTFTAASFNGESIRPWFWLGSSSIQLCLRNSTL